VKKATSVHLQAKGLVAGEQVRRAVVSGDIPEAQRLAEEACPDIFQVLLAPRLFPSELPTYAICSAVFTSTCQLSMQTSLVRLVASWMSGVFRHSGTQASLDHLATHKYQCQLGHSPYTSSQGFV